jgi:hypothetical protein
MKLDQSSADLSAIARMERHLKMSRKIRDRDLVFPSF